MLVISNTVTLPQNELEFQFIRAQGAGAQHVNKASTAVQLRFDFLASRALPDFYKERLLATRDRRISKEGVIVIKAQRYRSQEANREEALRRLAGLIRSAGTTRKKRRPTAPTRSSRLKRLTKKAKDARTKQLRKAVRQNNESYD